MAEQARRWAEATAPQAHLRQVGEAGPRLRLQGRGPGDRNEAPALGGWEWSPESEPKPGTLNLAKERLAVLGTPGEDGREGSETLDKNWTSFPKSGIQETDQKEK